MAHQFVGGRVVAQALRCLPSSAITMPLTMTLRKAGLSKGGPKHRQGIKPAAGLIQPLRDEFSRKTCAKTSSFSKGYWLRRAWSRTQTSSRAPLRCAVGPFFAVNTERRGIHALGVSRALAHRSAAPILPRAHAKSCAGHVIDPTAAAAVDAVRDTAQSMAPSSQLPKRPS